MNEMRRIGILGGMGPEATLLLMQRIMQSVEAVDDRDHIPLLVDNNTQVPSRIEALIHKTGPSAGPVLARMAGDLEQWGAAALAMPCNTAHHYAAEIEAAVNIPLLNMVELSVAAAAAVKPADGKVGILGSPALEQVDLYGAALRQRGLSPVYVRDRAMMLRLVQQVKADGVSAQAHETLSSASWELMEQGAGIQLIACSEFSLLAVGVDSPARRIDCLDVLVGQIRRFACGNK